MNLNCLKLEVNGQLVWLVTDDDHQDIQSLINTLNELARVKPDAVLQIATDDDELLPLVYGTVLTFPVGSDDNVFTGVTLHELAQHIRHRWAAVPLTFGRKYHHDWILPDEPVTSHIMLSQSPAYDGEMRE